MFSHLSPAEVRAATRSQLRTAVDGWFAAAAETGPPGPAAAASQLAATTPAGTAAPPTAGGPPAESRPIAAGAPLPSGTSAASGLRPISAPGPNEVEPALVAQLADRSRLARDHRVLETRLTALGAIAFECQPVPGAAGLFASGCRVPVDPTGQLQRVFQATGSDPAAATEALVEQVQAWRQRAPQPGPAIPGTLPTGDDPSRSPPVAPRPAG
jgi:hypothetical protein